jgi:hypothetical protein
MAKTKAEADVALASGQTPATENDPLIGSWAGFGATAAIFEGDRLLHLDYPPGPQRRRYQVDPITGLITRRIA